jgi:DNA excision repair protein ERCC-3
VLREQWLEKLKWIVQASNTEVHTYSSYEKLRNIEWGLVIFDECHHLPANTFSKLATLKAEYRIGLSATPYREDGRTDYIFALTGYPLGLDWKVLIDLGLIKTPKITLMLCMDYNAKKKKVQEMLQDPIKTLIYSFGIDEGEKLSKFLEIPFVHGDTPVKERLNIIKTSITTIISSAGREGLSVPDIKRTITYNFLFGSRQEESQFFGRLLHGSEEGEHYILMTDEEYENYGKRIYGIEEKGFKIRMVRI